MQNNVAYIQVSKNRWLSYSDPVDVIQTNDISEVYQAFAEVEKSVNSSGLYAVGYISYEAAPAFDSAFSVKQSNKLPLVWFSLHEKVADIKDLLPATGIYSAGAWEPDIRECDYHNSIKRIKRYIEAGDTYQSNYTFRLKTPFKGDAYAFFNDLRRTQNGRNCAFLDIGDYSICSASPELFFAINGKSLKSCPMKGTAARGLTWAQDIKAIDDLSRSEKNRAENVMIVDMIRNDLGRVAEPGSVYVQSSFDVERYPTVLQMTSTVRAKSSAAICDIMRAMFPCSSITGAPKVRTMEIIKELESSPRGIYTGAIGCIAPDRKALFNVAIRTAVIDKRRATAEYGVGGGIVWDSLGTNEYEECIQKAKVLTVRDPDFELLETMRWTRNDGYFLLEQHIERIVNSAEYFSIELREEDLAIALAASAKAMKGDANRVRLLVDKKGQIQIDVTEIDAEDAVKVFKIGIARNPVDSKNKFLYHKTTNRGIYKWAKDSCPDCDDVILFNERGEVTETTIANIVAVIGERKITPPVESGLLPGTLRAKLIETGEIEEGVLTLRDLKSADKLFLINSVRGWLMASI